MDGRQEGEVGSVCSGFGGECTECRQCKAELGNDLAPVDSRFVPPVSQPALRCCWGLLVGHERKCAFVWLLM